MTADERGLFQFETPQCTIRRCLYVNKVETIPAFLYLTFILSENSSPVNSPDKL
jgi:hypothetical protein